MVQRQNWPARIETLGTRPTIPHFDTQGLLSMSLYSTWRWIQPPCFSKQGCTSLPQSVALGVWDSDWTGQLQIAILFATLVRPFVRLDLLPLASWDERDPELKLPRPNLTLTVLLLTGAGRSLISMTYAQAGERSTFICVCDFERGR